MTADEAMHTLVLGPGAAGGHRLKLHPVVLLSILDHYLRREPGQTRVVGALLGIVSEHGEVEIRNSFAVPMVERDEGEWEMDYDFYKTMYDLHQRVNSKEVTIGWYATGTAVSADDYGTHEYFAAQVRTTAKDLAFPIHLTVDTSLQGDRLGFRAYTSAPVGVSDSVQGHLFTPVPCEVHVSQNEKAGVDLLLRAREAKDNSLPIESDLDNLEAAMAQLQTTLQNLVAYVDDVVGDRKPKDEVIGRYLMDAVLAVPKIGASELEQVFNGHVQDLLMVVYLSNMTRAQLALAERMMHVL